LEGADLGTAYSCCREVGIHYVDVIDSLVHSVPVQLHVKPLLHIFKTLEKLILVGILVYLTESLRLHVEKNFLKETELNKNTVLPNFTDLKNTYCDSSHGLVEHMILGLQQFNLAF
jgi:hypothetical protein